MDWRVDHDTFRGIYETIYRLTTQKEKDSILLLIMIKQDLSITTIMMLLCVLYPKEIVGTEVVK
jgi:hypothetical protein